MQREILLNINDEGVVRAIHDDEMADLFDQGRTVIARASNVEPGPDGTWTADLTPVGGPVLEGYHLRRQALDAEVHWINTYLIDKC